MPSPTDPGPAAAARARGPASLHRRLRALETAPRRLRPHRAEAALRTLYALQGRPTPEIAWASDPAQGQRLRRGRRERSVDLLEAPRQAWRDVRALGIPGGPVRACSLIWWLGLPALAVLAALILLAFVALPAADALLHLTGASPAWPARARFAAAGLASALTFVMAVVAVVEALVRVLGGTGRWRAQARCERATAPPSEVTRPVQSALDRGAQRLAAASDLALSAWSAVRTRARQRRLELAATARLSVGVVARLLLLAAALLAARPQSGLDAWSVGLRLGFGIALTLALLAAGAVVGEGRRRLPRPPDGDDGLVIALGAVLFTVTHLMLADYAGRGLGLSRAAPLRRVFEHDETWWRAAADLSWGAAGLAALGLVPLLITASYLASRARLRAGRRAVRELRLFARAYEAGASLYWATGRRVILVPRPRARVDEAGRLHDDRRAAVVWTGGRRLYFWRGVAVPADVVRRPERLTLADVDREPDPAVRRARLERYGEARYFDPRRLRIADIDDEREEDLRRRKLQLYGENRYWVDSGARLVDGDRFGELYHRIAPHVHAEPEVVAIVKVRNTTAEPDGTHRLYYLRVPPELATAHEAVAWTFGLTADEYQPIRES